eukprot:SAG31_NODE_35567_length_321_cov_30.036036_1_plen_41_part_01
MAGPGPVSIVPYTRTIEPTRMHGDTIRGPHVDARAHTTRAN